MLAIVFVMTDLVTQNYCNAQSTTQKKAPKVSSENPSSIIGNTIKIRDIEIAEYDFPKNMTLDDAEKACAKLGNGWRCPSKNELNIIYQNKKKIMDLKADLYWTSTKGTFNFFQQDFRDGKQQTRIADWEKAFVRPVKSIAMPMGLITGTTVKIGNLEIAQYDFINSMDWRNANKVCANLGEGWRLPTKEELSVLYKNKDKIVINSPFENSFGDVTNFNDEYGSCLFWSSSERGGLGVFIRDLIKKQDQWSEVTEGDKDGKCYVRAVRTIK